MWCFNFYESKIGIYKKNMKLKKLNKTNIYLHIYVEFKKKSNENCWKTKISNVIDTHIELSSWFMFFNLFTLVLTSISCVKNEKTNLQVYPCTHIIIEYIYATMHSYGMAYGIEKVN